MIDIIDTMLHESNVGNYLDLCLVHSPDLGQKYTIKICSAYLTLHNQSISKSIEEKYKAVSKNKNLIKINSKNISLVLFILH